MTAITATGAIGATASAPASSAAIAGYNEAIVRRFTIATVFWGVFGFAAGTWVATLLAFPELNIGLEGSFGRLRPVHTSAVILGFAGNALFATSFYVVQRTCRTGLWGGPRLANAVFWGYQAFLIIALTGYVMGITQSREYAEPEWYADIWLTVVWVGYLAIFVGTLATRREPHIYVANWFFLAYIITVAVLHIINNLAMPVSFVGT